MFLAIIVIVIVLNIVTQYKSKQICDREIMCNLDKPDNASITCNETDKAYLWIYWERIGSKAIPPYIELCIEIMKKNTANTFNLIALDQNNVKIYLPNLRTDIDQLPIAQKTDYLRMALLYNYGKSLWLDADILVMNDMQIIRDVLNTGVDFLASGCTGTVCKNDSGYGRPSNWCIGTGKRNSVLIGKCLSMLDSTLDKYFSVPKDKRIPFGYHHFGKQLIWNAFDEIMRENSEYRYYHLDNALTGSRDSDGNWIVPNLIFENQNIKYADEEKMQFIVLANSYCCGDDKKYNWFCPKSRSEILNGKYFISKYFNKALNYKPMTYVCENK